MLTGKAVIFTDCRKVEFSEIELPEPGPEELVVRTRYSWISNGTESSFLRAERTAGDIPYQDGDPWPFPIVPGYQKTGVVDWVGASVTGIEVGDWVFASVSRVGDRFFSPGGGHVCPAVTHRSEVWKLPNCLSPTAASGLVLTQVGYNCAIRPPIQPGDVALVIGDGQVGQWAAQTLYHRGAEVILAGKHNYRLEYFPADERRHRLNVTQTDLEVAIPHLAPQGLAAVIDTAGSVTALENCYPFLQRNAHLVSAGFHGTAGAIDIQRLRLKELALHAPAGWTRDRIDATLELLAAGHLETESLITHRFPADQAPAAYQLVLERSEPVLGVVLEWPE